MSTGRQIMASVLSFNKVGIHRPFGSGRGEPSSNLQIFLSSFLFSSFLPNLLTPQWGGLPPPLSEPLGLPSRRDKAWPKAGATRSDTQQMGRNNAWAAKPQQQAEARPGQRKPQQRAEKRPGGQKPQRWAETRHGLARRQAEARAHEGHIRPSVLSQNSYISTFEFVWCHLPA